MQRIRWAFLALCLASLPTFAAVTGVVMTTDGQPIAGARVSLRAFETREAMLTRLLSASPELVPIASTQTDAKGTFSIESPKEPTVDLAVSAKGYEPQQRRIERDEEVGALALRKTESRKGSVTAAGKPVAGATVVIQYGSFELITTTDAQGRYEAPDPKRIRSIVALHPDYAVSEEAFAMSNATASVLHRTLLAGQPFQGRVVSGEKDTPVEKALVLVDGWPLATTGEDGKFTIAHMPARWKVLSARHAAMTGQRAFAKEATATIRLGRGATISGRVTDAKTRVPVTGAIVRAGTRRFGPGSENAIQAITDAKGVYSIPVSPGTYSLLTAHPGYEFKPVDAGVAPGQQTVRDLSLAPLARVSGVVQDDSKRPVVVAALEAENAESGRFGMSMRMMRGGTEPVVSGPDGRFSMRVQPDEQLRVHATKRGLPAAKSDLMQLTSGERKSGLVLTIPTGIAVTGKAIDTHGDPLSGVSVIAAEVETGQRGMMMIRMGMPGGDDDPVLTGSDGTFSMQVKEGTYDFTFTGDGLAPKLVRGQSITVTSVPVIEATMEPGAEIAGRVVRGGVGLQDVMVMAMVPTGGPASATTGPDGSFTLTGLAAGSVRLIARKEDDFVQEMRSVTAPARDLLIEVAPGGRVTGRVVEKGTSKPVTTFQAGIATSRQGPGMMMMAPPQLRNFTSDDGTFTLESVPPGATILVASAPGFASARLNITVEAGKELKDIELQLDTGVKLLGRVTGPSGSPVGDVRVRLLPSPTGGFAASGSERSATTDANGDFSIEGLEAGAESVSFAHPKHSEVRKSVTLKGRETRLDVQLAAGGRVSGIVVTESGAPVGDAVVDAFSSSGSDNARTNAAGAFELSSISPGRYRFRASKSGYADGVLEDVDVSTGAPVRIVVKTGGVIYGRITGLTEQELSQTQVTAFGAGARAEGSVDARGNYRIEGVAGGTLQVAASTGGMSGTWRNSPTKTIDLAPGGSQQVDIEFRSDVVISGRVLRNGTPLPNASVNFFPRGSSSRGGGSAFTDNDGRYSVTGLEDGEYNVMVSDVQRMSPYSTTYQVRGTTTYDIEYRTNALRGRVLDLASNEPLANVSVQLVSAKPTESMRMGRGSVTDSTGSFILDSIPAGSYVITASKDGFANDVKNIEVTESAPQDLELHLARNEGVILKVVDARNGTPLSARAAVFDGQGRLMDETRIMFGGGVNDTSGLKLNVGPGSYTATVWTSGYAPRSVSFQSPSTQTVGLTPGGILAVRSKHDDSRRVRLIDSNGQPYWRFGNMPNTRDLVPSPGTSTYPNIAPGVYTLQLLDREVVIDSRRIVVTEGQTTLEEM